MRPEDDDATVGKAGAVATRNRLMTSVGSWVPKLGVPLTVPEQASWDDLRAEADEKAEEAGGDDGADQGGDPPAITTPPTSGWQDAGLRSHQRIAARLATWAVHDVCYVHGAGWHYWDRRRWARDHHDEHVNARLTELLRISWVEGFGDKDLAQDVRAAMTASGSRGVLDLASRRMWVAEVDADPWMLNCRNGTLDLHTLQLRPHDPADLITKMTGAAYYPDASSTEWEKFLTEVLPDPQVRGFLQRYAGVALIGKVVEQVMAILTGGGRNGKGVTARTSSRALGEYAVEASNDMLTAGRWGHKSAGELSALMSLRGRRWVTMTETSKGAALDETLMKYLTGGDMITAKLMGRDWVEFEPSHSILMSTNDLPEVDADAAAVWARLRIVPFDVSFIGREDPGLEDRLALQLDAVLTWAVEGLRDYRQRGGLDAPKAVLARTAEYRVDNDPFTRFVDERCVRQTGARVQRSELAAAYAQWAIESQEAPLKPREIAAKVRKLPGVGEVKTRGKDSWTGMGLRSDADGRTA